MFCARHRQAGISKSFMVFIFIACIARHSARSALITSRHHHHHLCARIALARTRVKRADLARSCAAGMRIALARTHRAARIASHCCAYRISAPLFGIAHARTAPHALRRVRALPHRTRAPAQNHHAPLARAHAHTHPRLAHCTCALCTWIAHSSLPSAPRTPGGQERLKVERVLLPHRTVPLSHAGSCTHPPHAPLCLTAPRSTTRYLTRAHAPALTPRTSLCLTHLLHTSHAAPPSALPLPGSCHANIARRLARKYRQQRAGIVAHRRRGGLKRRASATNARRDSAASRHRATSSMDHRFGRRSGERWRSGAWRAMAGKRTAHARMLLLLRCRASRLHTTCRCVCHYCCRLPTTTPPHTTCAPLVACCALHACVYHCRCTVTACCAAARLRSCRTRTALRCPRSMRISRVRCWR